MKGKGHRLIFLGIQTVRRCPMVFFHLPQDMINAILQFAIAGMCLQERLALKAALNFMVSWATITWVCQG